MEDARLDSCMIAPTTEIAQTPVKVITAAYMLLERELSADSSCSRSCTQVMTLTKRMTLHDVIPGKHTYGYMFNIMTSNIYV